MDWLNWILAAFSAVTGGSALITLLMFRKQQKRYKTAEAFEKEVIALSSSVESLKSQISFYDGRLNEMQKLVVGKDVYIGQLTQERHTFEIKNSKNKSAINKAYSCEFCDDCSKCPVLKQRAANEEAYLREISKEESYANGKC